MGKMIDKNEVCHGERPFSFVHHLDCPNFLFPSGGDWDTEEIAGHKTALLVDGGKESRI